MWKVQKPSNSVIKIVTHPGFAWLIRRVLDLIIKFIWPLYNWLQQFTTYYLTHCHLPIGHSTGTILTSKWTPLYSVVHLCIPSIILTVPFYNSSARTQRKTPSSVVKNACLLVPYLAMDVLVLRACASGIYLPSRCLAIGICVVISSEHFRICYCYVLYMYEPG
jgi:hypothetical protein